jgi:GT2 family glycosyltransferase
MNEDGATAEAITAVIINWRTPQYTIRAAQALIDDGVPASRIVIVDNDSGDGSPEAIERALPDCVLLQMGENAGFARGNNAGARRLPAREAYLLVNSDAFVHRQGTVARLLMALHEPGVAIAIPRLLNEDLSLQPTVMPFHGPLPALVRASGLSRLAPNELQPRLGTHWDHAVTRDVDTAIGAVLAVRADVWDQLRGFDDRLFMYVEDHDLFLRTRERGWRTRFVADAEFVHLGGVSSAQVWADAQRAYRIARAEVDLLALHMGPGRRALTVALMAGGHGARALWFRARGDQDAARTQAAWLRGYLSSPASARAPRA